MDCFRVRCGSERTGPRLPEGRPVDPRIKEAKNACKPNGATPDRTRQLATRSGIGREPRGPFHGESGARVAVAHATRSSVVVAGFAGLVPALAGAEIVSLPNRDYRYRLIRSGSGYRSGHGRVLVGRSAGKRDRQPTSPGERRQGIHRIHRGMRTFVITSEAPPLRLASCGCGGLAPPGALLSAAYLANVIPSPMV